MRVYLIDTENIVQSGNCFRIFLIKLLMSDNPLFIVSGLSVINAHSIGFYSLSTEAMLFFLSFFSHFEISSRQLQYGGRSSPAHDCVNVNTLKRCFYGSFKH